MNKNVRFIESFCNFMAETEGLTKEDIIDDLASENVDIDRLRQRVSETIKQCSKERRLSWRNDAITKQQLIGKLLESKRPIIGKSNLRNKIKDIIADSFGMDENTQVHAYFRKIESLNDDDLESLIEDIEDLNLLDALGETNGS